MTMFDLPFAIEGLRSLQKNYVFCFLLHFSG
jgi:hypothetical protein